MIKTVKCRLYPNPEQKRQLENFFGCKRWLWNNSLDAAQAQYKATGKGLGQFDLNRRITDLKKEFEWLKESPNQVLQSVNLDLSRSFINFFQKRTKFPKFKKKRSDQSIRFSQYTRIQNGNVWVSKLYEIRTILPHTIIGVIKYITISKTSTDKYFASIVVDDGLKIPEKSMIGRVVGVDLGLKHLITTSDGEKIENLKLLDKFQKNLKRKQQKWARTQKRSRRREKARLLVAKVHEKITNSRTDYLHKISRKLVNENQVICFENLNVKEMMQSHNLARAISDVGWSELIRQIKYKTEWEGKVVQEVDRFYPSSQICNKCLYQNSKLALSDRSWKCPKCSSINDRDLNASLNIRDEGLRILTSGTGVTARGGVVRQRGRKKAIAANSVESRN